VTKRLSYKAGVSFGALSFLSIGVVGLFSSVAVARVYGVHAIGQWAISTAPVNAVWFLSSFRERPALVRELTLLDPRSPRVTGLFAAVFTASFGLTVVVASIGLVVTWIVFHGLLHHPHLFGMAFASMLAYVFITNTCFNLDTIVAGFRAGRSLYWIRLHQAVAFVAFAVAGGLAINSGPWMLVAATAASYGTSLLHRFVSVRHIMRWRVSRQDIREGFRTLPGIVRFGLKIMPGGIADGIGNECGTWILASVGTVSQVGAYNRAWTLARRFVELNWRMTEMLFPTLVERRAKGQHEGFDRVLLDSLRYAAAGLLLPAAAAGGASRGVMHVFGHGFENAAGAMAVLSLMPALATLSNMQRHALYAVNRPWHSTISASLRMLTTVGAGIGLTLAFGGTGMALGVVAGYAVDLSYMGRLTGSHLTRRAREWVPLRQWFAIPAAYAAGFATSHVVYGTASSYPGLVLALVAGLLAYAATFVISGGIGQRDRKRAAELRTLLVRRLTPAGRRGVSLDGAEVPSASAR
jgi:O-antigen/teichoic acid export membrane protein